MMNWFSDLFVLNGLWFPECIKHIRIISVAILSCWPFQQTISSSLKDFISCYCIQYSELSYIRVSSTVSSRIYTSSQLLNVKVRMSHISLFYCRERLYVLYSAPLYLNLIFFHHFICEIKFACVQARDGKLYVEYKTALERMNVAKRFLVENLRKVKCIQLKEILNSFSVTLIAW